MSSAFRLGSAVMLAALGSGIACSANSSGNSGLDNGSGNNGSGADNSGGTIGLGTGGSGVGAVVGTGGDDSEPGGCQQFEINFEPKTPTVFVLVDRSGSMFDAMAWEPLRAGVLSVIQDLQADVRFGFGAFTGEVGQTCPMFDEVGIDLNNYDPIASVYSGLGKPTKGETPTMQVLATVLERLSADPSEGSKNILFVTDGEPDYCGDGNAFCPVDAVVWRLQELQAAGVNTFVFGIKSTLTTISDATLQAFANAGLGQPVAAPGGDPLQIYNQCFYGGDVNATGWKADFATTGKGMNETLGTYSPTGGTATVYKPDATDEAALTEQIRSVVSGVKSCLFDLGGQIEVDVTQLASAHVLIEGAEVPLDEVNGWRMNDATQLELVGEACTSWRDPTKLNISFDFPCEIIIVK